MTRFAGKKVDLSTYMNTGTDFGKLAESGQEAYSFLKDYELNARKKVASAGVTSLGNVMSGKLEADEKVGYGRCRRCSRWNWENGRRSRQDRERYGRS